MVVDKGVIYLDEMDIQILQELKNTDYISSTELALIMGVSERTIRKRIKEISILIQDCGANLGSVPGLGIRLNILNLSDFERYLNRSIEENASYPKTKQGRIDFIIDYLLLSDSYVNLTVLCEQLYISRSTLSNDLIEVRKHFERFNIRVVDSKRKGVKLSGSETDIRRCLSQVTLNTNRFLSESLGGHEQYEAVSKHLSVVLQRNNFVLSDIGFQNLCNHLYILMERIKNQNHTKSGELTRFEIEQKDLPIEVAKDIASEFSKLFKIVFPQDEVLYIAIHLAGKQNVYISEFDVAIQNDDNLVSMVRAMLESIHTNWNIDLRNDKELLFNLVLHFKPLLIRIKSGFEQKNPMLGDIKKNLSLAYLLAVQSLQFVEVLVERNISADEVAFVALHINLALARKREGTNRKRILILCSTGRGSSELLAYQVRSRFSKQIKEIVTSDVAGLPHISLDTFDLIITTINHGIETQTPTVHIGHFLDDADMNRISRELELKTQTNIEKYFKKTLFLSLSNTPTRTAILEGMVHSINESEVIPRNFLELILQREAVGSTDYGNLIALPHPNQLVTQDTFVCIAVLDKPILWERSEVQVVILVSIQKDFNDNLEHFYRVMSEFMASRQAVHELIKYKDFERFIKTIRTIDDKQHVGGTNE
ncbi:transcription antiterminator [Erysipelothrix sp. HDW6C]|uniref:BglG family transcription antiterminator n=1 Tax=Erysipelothrix sp. HDW6C TaxID=2714930 RepID=UPI00140C06F0|nr:BglG family transcription antiterminator [Erysipelothrix sp. HDW6C]QIK70301.1 transcription antiterminator [Erysipelothrix sp. HDW6C]